MHALVNFGMRITTINGIHIGSSIGVDVQLSSGSFPGNYILVLFITSKLPKEICTLVVSYRVHLHNPHLWYTPLKKKHAVIPACILFHAKLDKDM